MKLNGKWRFLSRTRLPHHDAAASGGDPQGVPADEGMDQRSSGISTDTHLDVSSSRGSWHHLTVLPPFPVSRLLQGFLSGETRFTDFLNMPMVRPAAAA